MNIVSSALASQAGEGNSILKVERLESLQAILDTGIRFAILKDQGNTDPAFIEHATMSYLGIIVDSLNVTEQTIRFAREDVSLFEVFLHNLHREYHEMTDREEPLHDLLHFIVAKDMSGLFVIFSDHNRLIKLLDFHYDIASETYNIEPVIHSDDPLLRLNEINSGGYTNFDDFESLCMYANPELFDTMNSMRAMDELLKAIFGDDLPGMREMVRGALSG